MLEFILYMLLAIVGVSLLVIGLIGVLLFVVIWVVASAEVFAYRMFGGRR